MLDIYNGIIKIDLLKMVSSHSPPLNFFPKTGLKDLRVTLNFCCSSKFWLSSSFLSRRRKAISKYKVVKIWKEWEGEELEREGKMTLKKKIKK